MTAKKGATARRSKWIGSDMKKVDAYVLGPKDYEEIPELTDEDFARGVWHIGGKPIPRGRPKADVTKDASTRRCARPRSCRRRRSRRRRELRRCLPSPVVLRCAP